MNKFIIVLNKDLADKYKKSEGLLFMNKTEINGQEAWNFAIKDKKFNFELVDKSKVLFTNKLMF